MLSAVSIPLEQEQQRAKAASKWGLFSLVQLLYFRPDKIGWFYPANLLDKTSSYC
jgi:hypothetical protein